MGKGSAFMIVETAVERDKTDYSVDRAVGAWRRTKEAHVVSFPRDYALTSVGIFTVQ